MAGIVYDWGGWTFEPAEWRLTSAAGEPVSLPNRTLDLLALLLDRAPSLVTKDEILSHVWRESVVEEGNIAFHIATLRKTLDAGESSCIETVRGRGYRFVAAVTRREPVIESAAPPRNAAVTPGRVARHPGWLLVTAAALTAMIGGVAWFSLKHDAPVIRSVTVLPLPDGLADVVAARVARDTSLAAVIGSPGPAGEDLVEAGKRLNAEAILTIAISRTSQPWRVLTEVTRTRDQSRLWSWQFTVNAGTPSVTHADIAARIASGLGRRLGVTRLNAGPTVNPAAYELFLQAREQWRQRTPHTVQQAITL